MIQHHQVSGTWPGAREEMGKGEACALVACWRPPAGRLDFHKVCLSVGVRKKPLKVTKIHLKRAKDFWWFCS